MKKFLTILLIAVSPAVSFAGTDEVKYFRPGIKIGSPNIAGFGFEYLLPFEEQSLGIDADVSYVPVKLKWFPRMDEKYHDTEFDILYYSLGGKYYLNNTGDGISFGLHVARYEFGVTQNYHYLGQAASARATLGATIGMIKLGYTWLWENLFLNLDVGYGAGKIDDSVKITVDYPQTGKKEEEVRIDDIFPIAHGVVASFTIGYPF